uniref:Uncharacterized protein n=1 Tax=Cupriavidus pinatubonensis (strain JMP 134 / LMG 1197) TaxID=264198 RepID=Q46Z71_CUPPJ
MLAHRSIDGEPLTALHTKKLTTPDALLPMIAGRYSNPSNYLYSVFPSTVPLLKYATPNVMGPALQQLFAQAKGMPGHYSWLHSWIARDWPERSEGLGSYDPQAIYNDAHAFAISYPPESKKGLLTSMAEMLKRELVPASDSSKLAEAACAVWGAHPSEAQTCIKGDGIMLSVDQAANLLNPIDWNNDEHIAALTSVWVSVANGMDDQERRETVLRILARGPSGTTEKPDSGLRIWLEVQPDSGKAILTALLPKDGLDDSHRARLWKQAVIRKDTFQADFFVDVVPRIVVLLSIDQTAAAVFDDHQAISDVLKTKDSRAELADRLMAAFPDAKTMTVKGRIAEYCSRLVGQGALKRFMPDELSEDDFRILESHFRGAFELLRLKSLLPAATK